MKNIFKSLGILGCGCLLLGLSSCDNEDFLNVDQYEIYVQSSIFNPQFSIFNILCYICRKIIET